MGFGVYEYAPVRRGDGGVIQSALRKRLRPTGLSRPNGLMLRGVVVSAIATDQDSAPNVEAGTSFPLDTAVTAGSAETYVNVIVYSGIPGGKWGFLPNVLVSHDRLGLHEGDVWIPRASRVDIQGILTAASNPADLDGDHVLIGFLDNDFALPVVLRSIPHPSADVRLITDTDVDDVGHRLRILAEDGEPRLWKHRGAVWGVDTRGNWLIDLTRAHGGSYGPQGAEPDPPEDGSSGNLDIFMQPGAICRVSGPDGQIVELLPDGVVRIESVVNQTEITFDAQGDIEIDARSGAGKVVVIADRIELGVAGVDESVILGNSYDAAHATYDVALGRIIAALSLAISAVAKDASVLASTDTASALTNLGTTLAKDAPTLATVLRGHLSDTVKVE